jgi:hypothetical protein
MGGFLGGLASLRGGVPTSGARARPNVPVSGAAAAAGNFQSEHPQRAPYFLPSASACRIPEERDSA